MIDLGFLLIRNVQKDVLIIQKYCHHLLPQAGLWQWTFFLKNFWSVFQSPVNVVFWCFPSLARMMELHWSKDSSEASQNLPGTVKRLQTSSSSSSLSLACSHAATGQVPDAQHRTPILMVSECALHLAEAVTRKPCSPRLRGQALAGGELSMRYRMTQLGIQSTFPQLPMKPNLPAQLSLGKARVPHPLSPLLAGVAPWEECPEFPACAGAQQGRTGPCSPVNTPDKHIPAVSLNWHAVCTGILVTALQEKHRPWQ